MDEPTTVSELLEKAELQEYCDAFEEEGYDSLSQLRKITENDLVDLIKDVQMKKGHVKRLCAALGLPEVSAAGSSAGPAPAAPAPAAPAPAAPAPAAAPQPPAQEPGSAQPPLSATNEEAQADMYQRLMHVPPT